jgi:hypothetical protein
MMIKSSKGPTNQASIQFPQNVTFRQNTTKMSSGTKKNNTGDIEINTLPSFYSLQLSKHMKPGRVIEQLERKSTSLFFEKPEIFKVINTLKLQVLHEKSKRKLAKEMESFEQKNKSEQISTTSEQFRNQKVVDIRSPLSIRHLSTTKKVFDFKRAETVSQIRSTINSKDKQENFNESNSSFYFYDMGLVGSDWLEYVGELKNGEKHGFGKWTLGNDEIFEGHFHEGKAHGKGRFVSRKGEVLIGFWSNNVFQKDMKHTIIQEDEVRDIKNNMSGNSYISV